MADEAQDPDNDAWSRLARRASRQVNKPRLPYLADLLGRHPVGDDARPPRRSPRRPRLSPLPALSRPIVQQRLIDCSYECCMGHYNMADDWKTLRVPPGAYEAAKAQKEAHDRTWGEQIVRDDGDGEEEQTENHEYDRWQIETEHQQRLLEQHAKTQEILERLPQDIADELEGRFR